MPERGFWNKCDFNRRRKTGIASDDWTSSRKEFQITNAATRNERRPTNRLWSILTCDFYNCFSPFVCLDSCGCQVSQTNMNEWTNELQGGVLGLAATVMLTNVGTDGQANRRHKPMIRVRRSTRNAITVTLKLTCTGTRNRRSVAWASVIWS